MTTHRKNMNLGGNQYFFLLIYGGLRHSPSKFSVSETYILAILIGV